MKYISIAVLSAMLAAPAAAQQAPPPSVFPQLKLPQELDEAFRKMMEDLKPSLEETLRLMERFETMGDPRHYHLPEVLPNGDIIIRRREEAPPFNGDDPGAPQGKDGVRT